MFMKCFCRLFLCVLLPLICSCSGNAPEAASGSVTSPVKNESVDAGAASVREEPFSVDASGWIVCKNLKLGLGDELGRAYVRRIPDFGVEIFFSNGVMTVPAGLLPDDIADALRGIEKTPHAMPREFAVNDSEYKLYSDGVRAGDTVGLLFERHGIPYAARPVYDIFIGQPLTEYFWMKGDRCFLGAASEDSKVVRKFLLKSLKSGGKQP